MRAIASLMRDQERTHEGRSVFFPCPLRKNNILLIPSPKLRGGVGVCDTWCGGDGSTTCGGSDGLSRDFYKIETGEATLGVSAEGDGVSNSGDPSDRLLELHNAAR